MAVGEWRSADEFDEDRVNGTRLHVLVAIIQRLTLLDISPVAIAHTDVETSLLVMVGGDKDFGIKRHGHIILGWVAIPLRLES